MYNINNKRDVYVKKMHAKCLPKNVSEENQEITTHVSGRKFRIKRKSPFIHQKGDKE